MREGIWADYQGKLYSVFSIEKIYKNESNIQYLNQLKVWEIDADRMLTIRFIIPDLGFDETIGPFKLFGSDKINHSPPRS